MKTKLLPFFIFLTRPLHLSTLSICLGSTRAHFAFDYDFPSNNNPRSGWDGAELDFGDERRLHVFVCHSSFLLVSPALRVRALAIAQVRVILGVCIKVATRNCSAEELPKYAL